MQGMLEADDIGVLSIHGTSTGANEENETCIWSNMFTTISRSIMIILRKGLLHGQWLVSYRVSLLVSNIDPHFQDRQFLMFPSKSIHIDLPFLELLNLLTMKRTSNITASKLYPPTRPRATW